MTIDTTSSDDLVRPTLSTTSIQHLALLIELHGIEAIAPRTLDAAVADARRAGANPLMAEIVLDPSEPAPARVRAFGRLLLGRRTTAEPAPSRAA